MLRNIFAFITLMAFVILFNPLACTNLQINQTSARFYENMKGNLRGFSNFSPGNPSVFSFSAMGDPHIGSSGGDLFQTTLTRSKADGDLFSVVLGDNSNTGLESELATFNAQAAAAAMTIFPVIGNHDIFFGGWGNYKNIIGRSIYSFDAGNVHFTALDTANGTFGEEQLNWLRADLSSSSKPIKIVMQHFPVYVGEFSSLFKIASDEETAIFKNLMDEMGVQLVLAAHYHGYSDKTLGNTRYVVNGACNHILDPGNRASYLKISINGTRITVDQKYL